MTKLEIEQKLRRLQIEMQMNEKMIVSSHIPEAFKAVWDELAEEKDALEDMLLSGTYD